MANTDEDKYQLVQMRLLRETVREIGELQDVLRATNRTDTVVRCIQIAKEVILAAKKGTRLQLVSPDETVRTIIIPGVSPQQS